MTDTAAAKDNGTKESASAVRSVTVCQSLGARMHRACGTCSLLLDSASHRLLVLAWCVCVVAWAARRSQRSAWTDCGVCLQPAPVFGSTFGTQGGFAEFKGVTPPAKAEIEEAEANGEDAEEECKAEFTPLVQLEEVETNTGEENEECLLEMCDSHKVVTIAFAMQVRLCGHASCCC